MIHCQSLYGKKNKKMKWSLKNNPPTWKSGFQVDIKMQKIIAKKSLGQNFLRSKKVLAEIIRAGKVSMSDTVLEIGPGEGALSEKLLESGAKVIAVEKDDRLIDFFNEKFSKEITSGQLLLIHGDILDLDLSSYGLRTNSYKLIANIPYYITGQIFRKFLEGDIQPSKIVILVQKEIADRIVARDGKESILSISVKAYGNAKKVIKVGRENFSPKPMVDSAVLMIDNISKDFFKNLDEKKFFEVLKTGFAHKRKVLIANLKNLAKKDIKTIFSELKIPEKARAENLKPENWKELAKML